MSGKHRRLPKYVRPIASFTVARAFRWRTRRGEARRRSGRLRAPLLELDRAVADLDVELVRRGARQLNRGEADDVQHRVLVGVEPQLLARLDLDRCQGADLRAIHRRGAGENDHEAAAVAGGRHPLGTRADLDVLDPECTFAERAEVFALHAGRPVYRQPVEVLGFDGDDVLVARPGELHLPALAPHLFALFLARLRAAAPASGHPEPGGTAELQHQLEPLARLGAVRLEDVLLRAVVQPLGEVAALALAQDALLTKVHVAHQGQPDLLERVPVPRHVEVRLLAAQDVAEVLQLLGLAAHEQVVEGHRAPGVVELERVLVVRIDLHRGPPSSSDSVRFLASTLPTW